MLLLGLGLGGFVLGLVWFWVGLGGFGLLVFGLGCVWSGVWVFLFVLCLFCDLL